MNSTKPGVPYIVVYRVLKDCIEVLAVLHARQEYPSFCCRKIIALDNHQHPYCGTAYPTATR